MDLTSYIVGVIDNAVPSTTAGITVRILVALFLLSLINRNVREAFKSLVMAFRSIFVGSKRGVDWFRLALFLDERYMLKRVQDIDFGDSERNFLFRTMLTIKIRTTVSSVKSYLSELLRKRIGRISKEQVVAEFKLLTADIIDSYERAIRMEFVKRYGDKLGQQLFDCVYNGNCAGIGKPGFKQYHKRNVEIIYRGLDADLESRTGDVRFVLYKTISAYHLALSFAINDLEKVFVDFDGHLDQLLNAQH